MRMIIHLICLLYSTIILGQDLYLPKVNVGDYIVSHTNYSLLYNENYEQANWIAYELTLFETIKKFERTNRFVEDPRVLSKSANDADYKGSGYDRGHLAPAADMAFSETAMRESFFYSNMSPQHPSFNRGVWKKLEEQVRRWANDYGKIQVVTGPIIENGYSTIGPNEVAIPQSYYKVILAEKNGDYFGIGLVLRNEKSSSSLQSFAVTVDYVEERTGIDFFYSLNDSLEDVAESNFNLKNWSWTTSTTSSSSTIEANQCKGLTQKGLCFKNNNKNEIGFFHHHVNQARTGESTKSSSVQCPGTTQKGTRCNRITKSSTGRCYQH